jgi:hypothetical protein
MTSRLMAQFDIGANTEWLDDFAGRVKSAKSALSCLRWVPPSQVAVPGPRSAGSICYSKMLKPRHLPRLEIGACLKVGC